MTNRSIVDKTWNVLLLLVFSRLPSDELYPCIEFYVQNMQFTQHCLEVMRSCHEIGPIQEVPSIETMNRVLVPLEYDCDL